jgi:xylan 1,4-beta-xylosidase
LKHGRLARRFVDGPQVAETPIPNILERRDFKGELLPIEFQSLRIPITEQWCSLVARPGYLRLFGKESLSSTHNQSLLARRVQSYHIKATTQVEFHPQNFQQMAGLVFYYNTGHYHYAYMTADYQGGQSYLAIASSDNFDMRFQDNLVAIPENRAIILQGTLNRDVLQFSYSLDGKAFETLGKALDASILSDDHVREGSQSYRPAFTGCFVGICCQDLASNRQHADFTWFDYRELH